MADICNQSELDLKIYFSQFEFLIAGEILIFVPSFCGAEEGYKNLYNNEDNIHYEFLIAYYKFNYIQSGSNYVITRN